MEEILKKYGLEPADCLVESITSGLINNTWKISVGDKQYILQRINQHVFKQPWQIAENIRTIADHLEKYIPGYLFPAPLKTVDGDEMVHDKKEKYYRLFPFIKGSHTIEVVTHPQQAFEAASQFGKFTGVLSGFDASKLHTTIPDFHNLSLRYQQFENAREHGDKERINQAKELITAMQEHYYLVATFEKIKNNGTLKQRVTHHDTKISNVLFDENDKGICIIDLDTLMPGYFISDLGDMMRTYLSPANEEEKDFTKISVREDYFKALVSGYLSAMRKELTQEEQELIYFSGLFLTYMQGLRFLTDHLNKDSYYGASYKNHNLVRAGNQMHLLKMLEEKKDILQKIIDDELKASTH